jgi:hypothetical protein
MLSIFRDVDYGADCVTGERMLPGDSVLNTGLDNVASPYMSENSYRLIKESTIVWLAEQAGYDVVKRDARDSVNAAVVDREDVSGGGGETKVRKVSPRGNKAVK